MPFKGQDERAARALEQQSKTCYNAAKSRRIFPTNNWSLLTLLLDQLLGAGQLVCGDCGSFFGQKVWHSTDAYRKVIWRCNGKFKGEKKCTTPHLDIETIQQEFLFAYNQLMQDRDGVIADCNQIRNLVSDCTALDAEIEKLTDEIDVVAEMVKACVKENTASAQSQEEYTKKYDTLVKRYEKTSARLDALAAEKARKQDRDRELRLFIESIKQQPLVLEVWNERLWVGLLEKA